MLNWPSLNRVNEIFTIRLVMNKPSSMELFVIFYFLFYSTSNGLKFFRNVHLIITKQGLVEQHLFARNSFLGPYHRFMGLSTNLAYHPPVRGNL